MRKTRAEVAIMIHRSPKIIACFHFVNLNCRLKPVLAVTHRKIFQKVKRPAINFSAAAFCAKGIHAAIQQNQIQFFFIFFIVKAAFFRHLFYCNLARFVVENRQIEHDNIAGIFFNNFIDSFKQIEVNYIVAIDC